jgi:hypothetical protein
MIWSAIVVAMVELSPSMPSYEAFRGFFPLFFPDIVHLFISSSLCFSLCHFVHYRQFQSLDDHDVGANL